MNLLSLLDKIHTLSIIKKIIKSKTWWVENNIQSFPRYKVLDKKRTKSLATSLSPREMRSNLSFFSGGFYLFGNMYSSHKFWREGTIETYPLTSF